MSTMSYEAFFPWVQPIVPSCPDPSIVVALRDACIEFCFETHYLQSVIDEQTVTSGSASYDLGVSTGEDLSFILALYVDGVKLTKKAPSELDELYRYMDWTTFSGQPVYYTQFNADEITLVPYPDTTRTLTGRMVRQPSPTSTTCDATLIDYREEIAQGALARLHMQPDQPYTSPNAAMMARQKFNAGIANAKAYVRGGMSASTEMKVRYKRYW